MKLKNFGFYAVLIALIFFIASNAFAQSITIVNSSAQYTNDNTPTLLLAGPTDVNGMKFSCSENGTYTDFIAFSSSYEGFDITNPHYSCTNVDDQKTVYVKFQTTGLVQNNTAYSDTIILERVAPSVSITSPQNNSSTENRTVTFSANDSTSGVSLSTISVQVNGTNSASFSSSACTASGTNYNCTYTENGFLINNTIYAITVNAQDIAGNTVTSSNLFTYIDTNAPSQVTGLSQTAQNQQVALTWSALSDFDLNSYSVYMGTSSGFTTDGTTLIQTVAAGTTSFTKTGLSNGTTYYFKVSAKDKSGLEGNDSSEVSSTPSGGSNDSNGSISAPSINSSTHSNDTWSTNNDPAFTWEVNSSYTYKCTFDQNDLTNPSSDCSTPRNPDGQQEGIWYFHLKACNSSGSCSSVSHFKVKVDRNGPSQPQNFNVSSNSNGFSLTWDSVTDNPSNASSGVKEYWIYRDDDDGFDPTDSKKIATVTSTSYTDSDGALIVGHRYYYKIRAVDQLNNSGSISAERSDIFEEGNECSNNFTFNFSEFIGGASFRVTVTSSGSMDDPQLRFNVLSVGLVQGQNVSEQGASISATYPIGTALHGKTVQVTLDSVDSSGNDCSALKSATIDRQGPIVSFEGLEENGDLLLDAPIRITASDAHSGPMEVDLFFRQGQASFVLLGNAPLDVGEVFEFTGSLSEIESGEVELKAQATDEVGNVTEAIITLNAVAGESEEVLVEKNYSFTQNVEQKLSQMNLKSEFVERVKALILQSRPTKKIEIKKVGEFFDVIVTISFTNNGNARQFKVVEVVPKDIAQSAGSIESNEDFRVLLDDPVLEFVFDNVSEDESVSFSYQLKQGLTEAQANVLKQKLEGQLANEIPTPMLFEGTADTSNLFNAQAAQTADLFTVIIIGIVILGVLIVGFLVIGGAMIVKVRNKSMTQLEKGHNDAQNPLMQKTSGGLKKWFENKDSQSPKKRRFGIK